MYGYQPIDTGAHNPTPPKGGSEVPKNKIYRN